MNQRLPQTETGSTPARLPDWFRVCVRRVRHYLNMWVVLLDPRIIGPPLRVYWKSRRARKTLPPDEGGGPLESTAGQRLRGLEIVRRMVRDEKMTRHRGKWVLNSFLPPFPGPAYERGFVNLRPGVPVSPFSAYVALTNDCPANCFYCSVKDRRKSGSLTTEQWLDVIAQLNAMNVSLMAFTGGEPLTRSDLPELVKAAADGGAATELFTSGLGLTEEKLDALRRASLWAFGVSLDSCDPEAVNHACGTPKAFDAAINALEMARRAGFYTFINAVAVRSTVESGGHLQLYDLARRLKLQELRLLEPIACGRLAVGEQDCFLTPEQTDELRRFHKRVNRRAWGPKVCAFSQIEGPEMFGCAGGTLHLYVDACGEVCPCDLTPLSFGNVLKERLEVIWERMVSAMGTPRCECFMKDNADLVQIHANGQSFPLPPETSCKIVAEAPPGPLPAYFESVSKHYGYPRPKRPS